MWLRLYTDILTSRKVLTLELELFKAWVLCLALAKEGGGLLPPIEDVAFGLRTSTAEAKRLTEALVKCGLLDITDEGMTPHNWDGRQFLSDDDPTAAVRARRYRQRNITRDATSDNADASRPPEQIQNRAEPDTEPEQSRGGSGGNPSPAASRVKRAAARRPAQCDEEFLEELQQNPAYVALDVKALFHKMVAWCRLKGKQPTRGRLLNWLNKEDKPMTAKASAVKPGNAHVGASPKPAPAAQPPDSNDFMAREVDKIIAEEDFLLGGQMYDEIIERGGPKLDWEWRVITYFNRSATSDAA